MRAAEVTADDPSERLPIAPAQRRDLAPRRDAQRDARPARGGARARAPLRQRRQPRAAHPARAAEDRARGRAAIREADEDELRSGDRRRDRRRSTACPARRGPARRRPLGRGRRWPSSASGSRSGSCSRRCASASAPAPRRTAAPLVVGDGARARGRRRPASRLEQALTSMIDNALRYGDGEVRLRAEAADGRRRDPRHRSRAGLSARLRGTGVRALRDRRPGARPRRQRARTGDRRDDRARPTAGPRPRRNADGGGADVWIEIPVADC